MKKFISLWLSALMLFTTVTAVPFVSSAENEEEPDYWDWFINKTYYNEDGTTVGEDTVDYTFKPDGTVKLLRFNFGTNEYNLIEIPANRKQIDYNTDVGYIITDDEFSEIGREAFYLTPVKQYVVPDTIKKIDSMAFACNSMMTQIQLSANLETMGSCVFEDCTALKEAVIPDSVMQMGTGTFSNCSSLEKVNFSKTVKSIPANTFKNCASLKSFEVPDFVQKIKSSAFSGCTSLTKISFGKNLTEIGAYAFENCISLQNIVIPNCVTKIEEGAFARCKNINSITLSNNLKSVGAYAFEECNQLKTIIIPKSVTNIGDKAFGYYYDDKASEYKKCKDIIIKGYSNTAAEQYAKKNAFKFVDLCSHKQTKTIFKKATYFADGYKNRRVCSVCNKVLSKGTTVKKLKLKTPSVKVTAGKKKITVKYTKVKDATGFQVKYTKGKKSYTKKFETAKSATKSITKLKKGKYKVQVRAYYLNSKKQKAYSPWTKAKSVTVK